MLRRIAYLSRPREDLAHSEIPNILAQSRRRNAESGFTGVLAYTGAFFVSTIEGAPDELGSLWAHILVDPRHCDVILLTDEPATERWFADWRAGFAADASTVARLTAWHERCAPLDEAEREELRRMLAACDAA